MVKFNLFHHHRLLRQILHRNRSKPQNTSNQSKVTATSNRHKSSGLGAARTPVFPAKCNDPQRDVEKRDSETPGEGVHSIFRYTNTGRKRDDNPCWSRFELLFFGCFVLFIESPVTGHEPSGRQSGKGATEGPNGFLLVPGTDEISYNNNSGFPLAQGIAKGRDWVIVLPG